jgi:GxxExxY protein
MTEFLTTAHTATTADLSVENEICDQLLDVCFYLHRLYGPGLLENTYEKLVAYELFKKKNLKVEIQKTLPLVHEGITIDTAYRMDMLIEDKVIVELKCVEKILPIHEAQILTYLKLSNKRLGIIINFKEKLLKNGIRRMAL